jgi:hypothetical protein
MYKLIFLLTSISPLVSLSQVNIVNRSLTDSSMKIAYIDVRNILELKGHKSASNLSFSTTNGTLMNLSENQYVLRPSKEGECVVSFFDKEKKIVSKIFRVESIPDPVRTFGSRYDSVDKDGYTYFITYNNLINDPVLRVETPNCYFKQPYKIVSYRITLDSLSGNGIITEFTVTGPEPTKEQIQIIKNYGANTFMTVEDIRSTVPDGRVRRLTPMIFNIN